MFKKYLLLIVTFFALALLAWSPWISKEDAEMKVREVFEREQKGIIDGCGFSCEGCGVVSSQKIPFGYLVNLKYKCGMKDYFREESRVAISFGKSFTINQN